MNPFSGAKTFFWIGTYLGAEFEDWRSNCWNLAKADIGLLVEGAEISQWAWVNRPNYLISTRFKLLKWLKRASGNEFWINVKILNSLLMKRVLLERAQII